MTGSPGQRRIARQHPGFVGQAADVCGTADEVVQTPAGYFKGDLQGIRKMRPA